MAGCGDFDHSEVACGREPLYDGLGRVAGILRVLRDVGSLRRERSVDHWSRKISSIGLGSCVTISHDGALVPWESLRSLR